MGYRTEYYETVDFTWVIARQLDRVAEAYAKVDPRAPGPGVGRLLMAVRALYALARLWAPSRVAEALGQAEALWRRGRHHEALRLADEALGAMLEELERRGLLVRKQDLPVGSFGGEE